MITSRPNVTLDPFFANAQCLEILATNDDICQYVNTQIDTSRLSKHVSKRPELRDEITSTITEIAKGMFLLAKLHIESLVTKNTIKAVRETLQHLPTSLHATYDEAVSRINAQNADDRQLALNTLTWVAYAERPLTVGELEEALAIEPHALALDADNVVEASTMVSLPSIDYDNLWSNSHPDALRDWAQDHPLAVYSQHFLKHIAKSPTQLDLQFYVNMNMPRPHGIMMISHHYRHCSGFQ
ncbi:hypothetical protein GGX14DRAFT_399113 [Mycena pura]|uniref:Uncharacterized protein n=1 Tax=Mycena pura TaxID=153505 RepID=A0AAD6Y946_9AGAR|nr:hypothetical protein GGX14DRAFT_399113 [Mycena pura]